MFKTEFVIYPTSHTSEKEKGFFPPFTFQIRQLTEQCPSAGRHPWLLPHLHLRHLQGCWFHLPQRPLLLIPDTITTRVLVILSFLHRITAKSPVLLFCLHLWLSVNTSFAGCQPSLSNAKLVTSLTQVLFIIFRIKASLLDSFWLSLYLPLQPSSMFSLLLPQWTCAQSWSPIPCTSTWEVPLPSQTTHRVIS